MDHLRYRRGVIRVAVTRSLSSLDVLLQQQPDLSATDLQTHFDFLQQKATELHQLDKEIFDAVDDEELENEMTTAQDYEEKISHQSTRVRCVLVVHLQSNPGALPLPTNDDTLAITQGNAREIAFELVTETNTVMGQDRPVNLVGGVP